MNKRKLIWAVISFCLAVLSIWAVVHQSKAFRFQGLVSCIAAMNPLWLFGAVVCMLGFIFFEGLAVIRIASALGFDRTVGQGLIYGAADVYVSAITPSASGGQPASAYFMIKDGMNASAVTTTLLLNLIMYSTALLGIGSINLLLFHDLLTPLSLQFRLLFGIGGGVIIFITILFYLLLTHDSLIYHICDGLLRFLEKLRIVTNGETKRKHLMTSLKQYHKCANIIAGDRRLLRQAFLLNVLQRLSQLGVTFFIFAASGRSTALSLKAMAMQCFVAVGSNCVPLPGAMGVADYMMLNGFSHLIGQSEAVTMELLCRGLTFYGCVLTGGILAILGFLMRRRQTC